MGASDNPFPHLAFQVVRSDRARLTGGGKPGALTKEYKKMRAQHAARLHAAARTLSLRWHEMAQDRIANALPSLPSGRPLLILADEKLDIDFLRSALGFEIVAEEEDGYIIVATEDIDFAELSELLQKFTGNQRGGARAAQLHDLIESTDERLQRILSDELRQVWPTITDTDQLTLDVSISCIGTAPLPDFDAQRKGESDAAYEHRKAAYLPRYREAAVRLDDLKRLRESELERFIGDYNGSIVTITEFPGKSIFDLPDCFTVRARVSGKCFKDLAQNYAHVFQIDDVESVEPLDDADLHVPSPDMPELAPPTDDAPVVCVIDSGIQEDHAYLKPAIVAIEARCFLPGVSPTDTADYVTPHGHGTRVAGAVLYPRDLPTAGAKVTLPCWIHNARVLDNTNSLHNELMPALYLEEVIGHFNSTGRTRPARIFNHSINSRAPFRSVHMSTWGASIDKLSYLRDVLIIQSAGNIHFTDVAAHLAAGRDYPKYQLEPASRVRNPGQSLGALTVGSISHTAWQQGPRASMAQPQHSSAFSPAGAGIWGSIKPDVVEFGGDYVVERGAPARVFPTGAVACELVRSTMHSAGATSKDDVGTSFAAPKVSHIAAMLARELPDEPCLLYRALIANSARWPAWAEDAADKLPVVRQIGYGIPDVNRATMNTEYRVTVISSGAQWIPAREAHIYHIPIPDELRQPEQEFVIRIDVTLAYASMPRRTRRRIQGYLATRLDWKVSKQGESLSSFRNRIFRNGDVDAQDGVAIFDWMLRENVDDGIVEGLSRQNGTLQKDWCYIRSNKLPPDFCIAVVGHPGWDPSPDAKAKYAMAVSFEAVNADLKVYTPIRVALETQVPVDVEQRIEVDTAPAAE